MHNYAIHNAQRIANDAYLSRTHGLELYQAKKKGCAIVIERFQNELENLKVKRRKLMTDLAYLDLTDYVDDARVDDIMAFREMEYEMKLIRDRVQEMRQATPEQKWMDQVGKLKSNCPGSLAVLNCATHQIEENFPINSERCDCGRSYRFNATLAMNFCPKHKIYTPVLHCGEERHAGKPKQQTNTSNKQQRLVITSQNQIIAANNPLYKEKLQHPMEHVARLRIAKMTTQKTRTAKRATISTRKSKSVPILSEASIIISQNQKGTPKKQRKQPSSDCKTNGSRTNTNDPPVIVIMNNKPPQQDTKIATNTPQSKKQQQQHFTLTTTTMVVMPKKQTNTKAAKFVLAYDKYLSQFSPNAPQLPFNLLCKIHESIGGIYLVGESRITNEITKIVTTNIEFAAFKQHIPRILKQYRGLPVPVIDDELRQRLLERYEIIHSFLQTEQQLSKNDGTTTKRKHVPCDESLTHIFLICEDKIDLASAFDLYPTMKVTPEQSQRFRTLIENVALESKLPWKFDFPLR